MTSLQNGKIFPPEIYGAKVQSIKSVDSNMVHYMNEVRKNQLSTLYPKNSF